MNEYAALLLADICDSTALGEALGDEAVSALWSEHDRQARALLRAHRGQEIDKSDGFLLVFADPADAARFALGYHRMLAHLTPPLKARAALHVGPIIRRITPQVDVAGGAKPVELDGKGKPLVARLMAISDGGRTLLTEPARNALEGHFETVAHGHWRLKGVAEPVAVFELASDGDGGPPADAEKAYRVVEKNGVWLPLREIAHSLPQDTDLFVGRQREIAELRHRFAVGARLITVTGTGGAGKTRLARRFGWISLGEFPGGVWFCDASQARSVDGFLQAIAQGLDVPLGGTDPPVQLRHAIVGRGNCLVVIDNCEQVRELAEATVSRWLANTGSARFLVTSRQRLHSVGESVMRLSPLERADACALFVARATAAESPPRSHDEVAAVEQVVALLDHLPLAIELAASRVQVMGVRSLLTRMSDRFRLLGLSARGGRQATLRTAFDWSWDLLSAIERSTFAQLSVFEGGIPLEGAEAVVELPPDSGGAWLIDMLQSLVEKSLLKHVEGDRFELLSTLKEYGAEHLRSGGRFPGSGAVAESSAERRHFEYFACLDRDRATRDRCIELDNIVMGCRRALRHGDGGAAVRCLVGAWAAIRLRGPLRAAADLANEVLASPTLTPAQAAEAGWVAGAAYRSAALKADARRCLEAALPNANSLQLQARIRCAVGWVLISEGRLDEALVELEAALGMGGRREDVELECEALCGLGVAYEHLGQMGNAKRHYAALLAAAEAAGDLRWQGGALGNLALIDATEGRHLEARKRFEAALQSTRTLGDKQFEGNTLCNLGLLLQQQGQFEAARQALAEALTVGRAMGYPHLEAVSECNLGIVEEAVGRTDAALQHYQAAVEVAARIGDRRLAGQFHVYLGAAQGRSLRFATARASLDAAERLLNEVEDTFSLALLRCAQSETEGLAGNAEHAARRLDEAIALAGHDGNQSESELGQWIARLRFSQSTPMTAVEELPMSSGAPR